MIVLFLYYVQSAASSAETSWFSHLLCLLTGKCMIYMKVLKVEIYDTEAENTVCIAIEEQTTERGHVHPRKFAASYFLL